MSEDIRVCRISFRLVYVRITVHKSFEQAYEKVIIYYERIENWNGFKTETNLTCRSYDCNI